MRKAMKKEKFYKLAKTNGWDFYTGMTINYREHIGKEVVCPKFNKEGNLCSESFIHASRTPDKCFVGAKIPCSAYLVKGIPIKEDIDKCGFEKLFIEKELNPEEMFRWNYAETINPIHPFKIISPAEINDKHIIILKKWNSVRDSVRDSVWYSVRDSVGNSVRDSVGDSVRNSVWYSVRDSVRNSVRDSVGDSVWDSVGDSVRNSVWNSVWDSVWYSVRDSVEAYIGSLFPLKRKEWKYTENIKTKGYPFQSAVDLWKMGLVASYDGKIWRLNGGKKAEILWSGKIN